MATLSIVLRLNALSCLGFGALFLIVPGPVAAVLGNIPLGVLITLGVVLVANGAHLVLASSRHRLIRGEILWFSLGDLTWWLATMALLAADLWITASTGAILAFAVATGVAAFGVTQLFLIGQARSGLNAAAHWRRIGRSWLSLPRWVKVWLFVLNAAFLLSPVFLPWWMASVVLIAYVATGPLLLAFAVYDGGLTRIMGVAHLVAWVPMLAWLVVVVTGRSFEPAGLGFIGILMLTTFICLMLDIYDLGRWLRGDRGIMAA